MSKFQSTISTVAALGTIAVTAVTAYRTFENHKTYNAQQEAKIKELQTQLKQLAPATQPAPVELPPVPTQIIHVIPPPEPPPLPQP